MKQCTKCVMDETDPNIVFDKNGVCNYCSFAEQRFPDRYHKREFADLITKIKKKGKNKRYDCLIGMSGGLDSSMVAHYVVKELGLRPLALKFDNGWGTEVSEKNCKGITEKLKIDHLHYCMSGKELAVYTALQMTFLGAGVPNAEIPTDHILGALLFKVANDNKIKYIISGGNFANEGTMPEAWSYSSKDLFHIKQIYKGFAGEKLQGIPTINLPQYLYCRAKIKTINLLDYYDYKEKESKELLGKEYGWEGYGNKHCENVFTRWFQETYLPKKFKIDKRKAHLSSLVQSGQITREQAVDRLAEPLETYDNLRIMKEFGLDEANYKKLMELPPIPHEDYQNREWLWRLVTKIYKIFK